jgi:hypothetical protein
MELIDRYEEIVTQGIAELDPGMPSTEPTELAHQYNELAPRLGDILYRLCIEHAVFFNPFRQDVIDLICSQKPVLTGKSRGKPAPFAVAFEHFHPLIVLALETMPPDPFE